MVEVSSALRVICAGGFRAAMEKIAPLHEKMSGETIALTFGTPAATREATIKGSSFDAVVVTSTSLNAEARAQLGATFVVAKSPVGMGFHPAVGARPVGTVDEFRAAIRAVKSIGLSDPKAGTNLGMDILAAAEKLGLAEDIRARANFVMGPGSVVSGEVAKGNFEAVMTLASEILTVPGVAWGGAIPEAMGLGTPFEAGVGKAAAAAEAATRFLAFLRTDEAKALMRSTGLVVMV